MSDDGQAPRVVLGLGSNVGSREALLRAAADLLSARFSPREAAPRSRVLRTEPLGPAQPEYLNAALMVRTGAGPEALLAAGRDVERALARERRERWGPRTLDVDVIDVDGGSNADPELTLPHPRAHERAFVLAPWADVAPDAVLPGYGRVADLVGDRSGVRPTDLELR
jgi:2-amino-4-hydroxy-6-hydroxymethyldihydropteridine diphosphokinase